MRRFAITVEVGGAVRLRRTRAPTCQQRAEIGRANAAVVIKVPRALSGGPAASKRYAEPEFVQLSQPSAVLLPWPRRSVVI